jgi:NTP pyrophosphatase (non-canonical NTP hydrolase)
MHTIEKLHDVNRGLAAKFPDGSEPFKIMTRLLEECGELAQQVHLFEDSGVKRAKYGEPDRSKLADEVKGVLLVAFQVIDYYDLAQEVEASLDASLARLRETGYLPKEM